jgi:spore coat-associated protein N
MQYTGMVAHRPKGSMLKRLVSATILAAAISALFILVVPTTFGLWTVETINVNNEFSTGELSMFNSRDGQFIVQADNMKPGDSASGDVTVSNDGSIGFTLQLQQEDVQDSGAGLASQLHLLVVDAADDTVVIHDGPFDGLGDVAIAGPDGAVWGVDDERAFTFTVTFPDGSGNEYMNQTASSAFRWVATQE